MFETFFVIGRDSHTVFAEVHIARVPAHWTGLAGDHVRAETKWHPGRRDGPRQDYPDHCPSCPFSLRKRYVLFAGKARPNLFENCF